MGGLGSAPETAFGTLDALTVSARACPAPVAWRPCMVPGRRRLLSSAMRAAAAPLPPRDEWLQGKGQSGRGVVVDLMSRRLLPCQL